MKNLLSIMMLFCLFPVTAFAKPAPGEALKLLKEGNVRFAANKPKHPHLTVNRFIQAGLENQSEYAFATIVACSDSRVPVEFIFDAGIMDLFVVRVAGNVCHADQVASIEYGLVHVKTLEKIIYQRIFPNWCIALNQRCSTVLPITLT